MSENKPKLTVELYNYYPDVNWDWRAHLDKMGIYIETEAIYTRKDAAKRGAIRALTKLGITDKFDLVFVDAE